MAIHGIPIKVRVVNEKGNDEPANVMFASCRKHPALKGLINDIDKLETDEQLAMRKMLKALEAIQESKNDDTEKEEKAASDAGRKYNAIIQKRLTKIQDFIVMGMKGAGYTEDDVDKYLPFFDPERYQELVHRCLVGCGRLDFFVEKSQQDANLSSM